MTERRDDIRWLQGWYLDQCTDSLEPQSSIRITTIGNPGWRVEVDLEGTSLEQKSMPPTEVHRSEHDWLVAKVEGKRFDGCGGPDNLGELIHIFRLWATEKLPRATGAWLKADREEQRRHAQKIVSRLLQGAQVQGIELRDNYTLCFNNQRSETDCMLTTFWNFRVLPAVEWPASLKPTQKQALELDRMMYKLVLKAECRENGGLIIEYEDDLRLEIYPERDPIIEQLWALAELGRTVASGTSKITIDTEGRYTVWQPDTKQEN